MNSEKPQKTETKRWPGLTQAEAADRIARLKIEGKCVGEPRVVDQGGGRFMVIARITVTE